MTGRPRSRRGQGEQLRDEILEAAETLLVKTGSEEAVSIRAVADAVGVTPPTIYRHFDDKLTLLFEVCSRQFGRLHQRLEEVIATETEPRERLIACGRAYVEFGLEHPEHYRIMFMGRSDWTPELYADEVTGETGSFTALVRVVEEVVDDLGVDRDPFEAATMLWTAVHGLTSLLISKPGFPWQPVDQMVRSCCEAQLRGVFGQE